MSTAPVDSRGLTAAQASARRQSEGPNALPTAGGKGVLQLAAAVLREPMFLLLIAASAVYLLLGDVHEALVLAASIVAVLAISVIQERRTERALEALRDLSSPRALVIRDGVERRIAGVDVVRGDLIVLREGDRVPADAVLAESHDLAVDESLLTGESVPVAKHAGRVGADRVMSGTLVVRGLGRATVSATGPRSELGKIGASLATLESGKTSLERETARMVRIIAVGALVLCVALAALYVAMRGDPLGGVLAGLTLAMAILPEEFPVVLTVFLALGAWRIGRHRVLTRRMPAIEMLGAATVLCCDKTGTLTENRMAVAETWIDGRWHERRSSTAAAESVLAAAALACELDPFDPMERAILAASAESARGHRDAMSLERRYPLSGDFLAVCHGWSVEGAGAVIAMKGAPETVVDACALDEGKRAAALDAAADAGARGLRVLAVARAEQQHAQWLDSPLGYAFEFVGLIALADPIRASVPAAIGLCRRAGVRVVMITGDHPLTARAIAAQAGIPSGRVLTGAELDSLDDVGLTDAVKSVQVFARVRPEQKLRLVKALRSAGEVVAMTGDGVNDAPALKAAHIGIAMGARGTDVAREAASLVLLDDDFTSIVGTIRLGRRIYDNIRNAMRYLLAVHVPIAGMSMIPVLAGWPPLLFPVHVVFMEFVIDPACSIAFEAERSDPHSMERPPRPPDERLFDSTSLFLAIALGASVLAGALGVYAWALSSQRPPGEAQALAFAAIIAGNLVLILANRSKERTVLQAMATSNRASAWIVVGSLAALLASIYVPAAAQVFRFQPPGAADMAWAMAAGAAPVLWYDFAKLARRARR